MMGSAGSSGGAGSGGAGGSGAGGRSQPVAGPLPHERSLVRLQDLVDFSRRAQMNVVEAARLARLFRLLAGPARLRILHALARKQERAVGEVAAELGLSVQAVSNQLQRLADRGLVAARREARRVLYRVADPRALAVLGQGWLVVEANPTAAKGRN